jgi:hypothetical protein
MQGLPGFDGAVGPGACCLLNVIFVVFEDRLTHSTPFATLCSQCLTFFRFSLTIFLPIRPSAGSDGHVGRDGIPGATGPKGYQGDVGKLGTHGKNGAAGYIGQQVRFTLVITRVCVCICWR